MSTTPAAARSHVDAYRTTGTSPGAVGRSRPPRATGSLRCTLQLDHHGPTSVEIGWEVQGPPSAPPVVVLGGISADRHPCATPSAPEPGWWRGVVGEGAPLDTRRLRVIGIDWLGGAEGAWRPEASVTTADQARAVLAVLDELGVDRARLVGASYGGMVALALALRAPERVERLALLCAAHRAHPLATGVRAVQRGILRLGDGSAGGDAEAFPVTQWLEARGTRFAERFDAGAFARLSESIDLHDVDPARLAVPTLLVSFSTDQLTPPWLVAELAAGAPGATHHVTIDTEFGHDAFLKEVGSVGAVLAAFLGSARIGEVAR